jgi:hypothetical protein
MENHFYTNIAINNLSHEKWQHTLKVSAQGMVMVTTNNCTRTKISAAMVYARIRINND